MPADPSIPQSIDPHRRSAERIADLERRLRTLEGFLQGGSAGQVPVVGVLPTPGREGRVRFLLTDGKLYVDNGVTWNPQT